MIQGALVKSGYKVIAFYYDGTQTPGPTGVLGSDSGNVVEAGPAETADGIYTRRKLQAVWQAFRRRWVVDQVLVCHIDFLKLLPLLRLAHSRTALVLHGIEAWKTHTTWTRALFKRVHLFLPISQYTWERFVSVHPEVRHAPHCILHWGSERPLEGPTPPMAQLRPLSWSAASPDEKTTRAIGK
ncbi:MAG: hypothetical protein NZ742_07410 [Acidobacteria bacterium]|nr:hypothetical protein [Acidobacteriota bacterium]MDW7984646.1 hypothetical protein [Acidobacteriota bacterium]